MHVAKDEVDVKMQIPGAVLRQKTELGNVKGFDKISGEASTPRHSSRASRETSVSARTGAS
jgi:hypothetical protein